MMKVIGGLRMGSTVVRLKEEQECLSAVKALLPPSNREPIVFHLSKLDRPGFALIEAQVSLLDQLWRESGEGYIHSDGSGAVEGRLDRFAEWLSAHPGKPINAPWVYINGRGDLSFADGRHRFALLRDRGYRVVKIAVRNAQSARLRRILSSRQELDSCGEPHQISKKAPS
jgi:hypothetical protein